MDLYALDAQSQPQLAGTFTNFFEFSLNMTIEEFVLYLNIPGFKVSQTNLTNNNCKIMPRNYDSLFTELLDMVVEDVDAYVMGGLDLTQKIPVLGELGKILR